MENPGEMALNLVVKVHPVVLFQIVDAYERRNSDANRVIGTLLGTAERGVVELTNSFCVPHKEYESNVEAELAYASDMFELNRQVNAQEDIVGWWATGSEITRHSSSIHDYYTRECSNPIHLTLDTNLMGERMGIKAYVSVKLGVPDGVEGCMFSPLSVEIVCYEPEVVGLQLASKTAFSRKDTVEPMMDLARIAEASKKLSDLLETVLTYVDNVLDGKVTPDNAVGRALTDMINSVPKMSSEEFDKMFNSNIKDLLMVMTLSQLVKTQLQLNEKLTLLAPV